MKKLLIITTLILFYSCKGKTSKIWSVSNNSNKTISVEFHDNETNETKMFTISPSRRETIKEIKLKGVNYEPGNPASIFSSFKIINETADICTKEYKNKTNWFILNDKKSPPARRYVTYDFSVENQDF